MELNGLNETLKALKIAAHLYFWFERTNSMMDFCMRARGIVTLSEAISFYKANN